jgi:hypothetical protein
MISVSITGQQMVVKFRDVDTYSSKKIKLHLSILFIFHQYKTTTYNVKNEQMNI